MDMANNAKISILIGSVVAAIIGLVWLKIMLVKPVEDED
jgi:Na+/H+ antiporter NhaA